MKTLIIALTFLVPQLAIAEDFIIDNYEFEWTVAEQGKVKLDVIKTDESSYIRLYKDQGLPSFLRLTGEEAAAISSALGEVNHYYKKQKGSDQDVSEEVSASGYDVTFRTSVKYGFSVTIRKSSGIGVDSFMLDRFEANGLQDKLQKSPSMLEYIDTKIKL